MTDTGAAAGGVVNFRPAVFTATMNNQLLDDITPSFIQGWVTVDFDLEVSKFAFEAELKTKRTVRPLIDFVAPHLELIYEDGTTQYEQVGLYVLVPSATLHMPGSSTDPSGGGGSQTRIDGRDLAWLLAADVSTGTTNMALGANVVDNAIADLAAGGFTRVAIPASTYTSLKAVSWPPGTSRLDRVNDRLDMVNYYTLAFDRMGVATSRGYDDLATTEAAVTYSTGYGSRVVPPIEDDPDNTRLCNRVVVSGTDPAQAPLYAIRENNDPLSPISYVNMGKWISRFVEDSQLQTQAAVDALANDLIRDGASYYRSLRLQTLPDPSRGIREVYQLDIRNSDGVVAEGKWRCNGWELPLDWTEPVMTHYLSRVELFTVTTP